jgi:hypothetical protein
MSEKPVRKFGKKTQHDYIRHIENLAKFRGRSPDTATAEDLGCCQVHQTKTGVRPPSVNSSAVTVTVALGRANLRGAAHGRALSAPAAAGVEPRGGCSTARSGPCLRYEAAAMEIFTKLFGNLLAFVYHCVP